jgi:hypothetical protein
MAHTDKDEDVAEAIRALLEANKVVLLLDDVLYGNHIMIPRSSAAVVMPLGKRRQLAGVSAPGGRTLNQLMVGVDLHWSKVGDEETERKNADSRGTAVEDMLHNDTTLSGIVIHGFVTQVDRGESQFANNSMFRSVRMVYEAQTKTYLS